MASRKRLKKNVRHICGEMLYVCSLSYAEKGQLTPEIQAAVQEVIRLQADIVCRISHTERGSVETLLSSIERRLCERHRTSLHYIGNA